MTIVYSTTFDAAVNTNLDAYGAPDWYMVKGTSAQLVVVAADDNVQPVTASVFALTGGLVHSLIGGINDYTVTGTIRRQSFDQMGGVVVRCGAAGSGNAYVLITDSTDDLKLYRMIAGTPTLIKTLTLTPAELPAPLTMIMSITVTGSSPVVLNYSLNGQTDSFSDSNAARLMSGPPGIMAQRGASPQAQIWVTDFSVDNLVAASSNPLFDNPGGWPCLAEYMRRRKKTPEQIEYERKYAAWKLRKGDFT